MKFNFLHLAALFLGRRIFLPEMANPTTLRNKNLPPARLVGYPQGQRNF